jgi:hypothetical protein
VTLTDGLGGEEETALAVKTNKSLISFLWLWRFIDGNSQNTPARGVVYLRASVGNSAVRHFDA